MGPEYCNQEIGQSENVIFIRSIGKKTKNKRHESKQMQTTLPHTMNQD
jgi:hypothetical protein